jgi:hypothetical protein
MYSAASRSHSVVMDGCLSSQTGIWHRLDFCLENTPDREVEQVQVQQIWRPIRRSPEFCQLLLGGPGGAVRLNLPKEVFSIRINPLNPGDHMLSKKLLVPLALLLLPRGQVPFVISKLFHLENKAPADAEA